MCACTPAAARSLNHHLQNLGAFKIFVLSKIFKIKLSTKRSQATLLSRKIGHRPGQYSNLVVYQSSNHTEKAQGKGIQIFIQGGNQQDINNDGIHLTFEMHNQVSQADHTNTELPNLRTEWTRIRTLQVLRTRAREEKLTL